MTFQYNLFNVLMIFGALQGIILCIYLYSFSKKPVKQQSPFLLFLFSLAFINLYYALMDIDFFAYFRALHVSPYPAKWLIAPALWLYGKKLFRKEINKKDFALFVPAFLINLPYFYWFWIAWKENSYRIVRVIIETDFFRYNEVSSILFNLILISYGLSWIHTQSQSFHFSKKERRKYLYLRYLLKISLAIFLFNLFLVVVDLGISGGKETRSWYYSLWLCYSIFIYVIGWIGFSNPRLILNPFKQQEDISPQSPMLDALDSLMEEEKLYRNADLRIAEAAARLQISSKELSGLINTNLGCNFSTYINQFRLAEIKEKILSDDYEKYTLLHIVQSSGFKSKSSFYDLFKQQEGMTPSAFRKLNKK